MKLSIGIIGLPNVGKSTLFNVLTKQRVNVANYPFTTIEPNVGVVAVPDEWLDKLHSLYPQKKKLPATVEFYDIAGLVKGAHKGEGLGNQFLAKIREVDALVHVVRTFSSNGIAHVEGNINPKRDLETVMEELRQKDLETNQDTLTSKPQIILINGDEGDFTGEPFGEALAEPIAINLAKTENLSGLIKRAYEILDVITFFTIGDDEIKAWTIKKETKAPEAGAAIHTDFRDKFIRAEVINWEELILAGSWQKAKEKGLVKTKGKDYIVQDGDVILFKI